MTKTQSIYIRCSKEEKSSIMINARMKKMNKYLKYSIMEVVSEILNGPPGKFSAG